jgi:TonB family protein
MIPVFILALAMQQHPGSDIPTNNAELGQRLQQYNDLTRNLENQQNAKAPPEPVFLKAPTNDDLAAVYPPDALARRITGTASIHCRVDEAGSFTGCTLVSEVPSGNGFGDAALKLSKIFQLSTKAADGSNMVGQSMTIPMQFKLN